MKIEDARKAVAAIGILAISLTGFHAQALAASGRINIQTAPEGARYLIVTKKDLTVVRAGISPYFDTAFPTGKYKVCFELDGYAIAWQDSIVATFGSSWVGPVMERSTSAARTTCEDEVAGMKAELGIIKSSVLQTVKQFERPVSPPGTSRDVPPEVVPVAPVMVDHEHDHGTYGSRPRSAQEIRDRLPNRPPSQQ
jgi:hypothetical protein